MELIDANWIKAHLTGRHGELKELADTSGLSPDKITKILNGQRQIKATEAPRIAAFFQRGTHGFSEETPLFQPAQAIPINATARIHTIAAALCPGLRKPEAYRMTRSEPSAGLLANDLLIVELGMTAAPGDLVIATLADTVRDVQATLVRRFWPPLIVPLSPDDPFPAMDAEGDQTVGILASVKAVARPGSAI